MGKPITHDRGASSWPPSRPLHWLLCVGCRVYSSDQYRVGTASQLQQNTDPAKTHTVSCAQQGFLLGEHMLAPVMGQNKGKKLVE